MAGRRSRTDREDARLSRLAKAKAEVAEAAEAVAKDAAEWLHRARYVTINLCNFKKLGTKGTSWQA